MIKVNKHVSDVSRFTEDRLPFSTRSDNEIFIYSKAEGLSEEKSYYCSVEINQESGYVYTYVYDSFDEMISDAEGSVLNNEEKFCDLEITVK